MTVIILAVLFSYLAFGAIFRAIGLAVRLVVLLALASAICALAGNTIITPP
jgi:hypothetical protein